MKTKSIPVQYLGEAVVIAPVSYTHLDVYKRQHLVSLGFDYCYDKTLYDCMTSSDNSALRNHIDTLGDIAPNRVHFLENHDEQRAATVFNLQEQAKYAHLITTLPGPCLWYDGQFSGYTAKLPTPVRRGPAEPTNTEIE